MGRIDLNHFAPSCKMSSQQQKSCVDIIFSYKKLVEYLEEKLHKVCEDCITIILKSQQDYGLRNLLIKT